MNQVTWVGSMGLLVLLLRMSDPGAQPLPAAYLDVDFTEPESLDEWAMMTGATTGPGPASGVSWDAGSVRLSGTQETGSWLAPTRTVEVEGASWLRLLAHIRTEGVDPSAATFDNCYVFAQYAGGLVASPSLTGTTDWTAVQRWFPIPEGTDRVTVGLLLTMPGRAWFDDVHLEAAQPPQWSEVVAGRYRYLTLPGDTVPDAARQFNDASLRVAAAFLDVEPPAEPITYVKYPDLETIEALTGRAGNARRDGAVIHSIWATDNHEIVHILADAWGDPPALLAEGLAVYLSGGWQGQPVRLSARGLLDRGEWIEPSRLLDTGAFRSQPDLLTYAVAGALVEWIVTVNGRETLRTLYGRLDNRADEAINRAALEAVLGIELGALDEAFEAWVRGTP